MKAFWDRKKEKKEGRKKEEKKLRITILHLSQILQYPKSLIQRLLSSQNLSLPKIISYIYFLFICFLHKPVTCLFVLRSISHALRHRVPRLLCQRPGGSLAGEWRRLTDTQALFLTLSPLDSSSWLQGLWTRSFLCAPSSCWAALAPRHSKSFPLPLSNPRVRVAPSFCYYLLPTPSQFDFPALPILWGERVISGSSFKIGIIIIMVNQSFCED